MARSAIEVPDLRSAIEEVHPDFLIIDTNSWGAQAVAETWGNSWAFARQDSRFVDDLYLTLVGPCDWDPNEKLVKATLEALANEDLFVIVTAPSPTEGWAPRKRHSREESQFVQCHLEGINSRSRVELK